MPDTKDWTWTTTRPCGECGFDASTVPATDLGPTVVSLTAPWPEVLAGQEVRQRPAPTTWSPLEYACHVHEVLAVFTGRFERILAEDGPTLADWDQDAAAIQGQYAEQQPAVLSPEIAARAERLAALLTRFEDHHALSGTRAAASEAATMGDEPTVLRRAWRSDGAEFTALSLARYLLHDLAHHLHDVGVDPATADRGRPGTSRSAESNRG